MTTKPVDEVVLGLQIGGQIRHMRKVKNLTQKELAQKVGTAQSGIARVENDNYLPSLSFLIRIANVLGKRVQVKLK